MPCASALGIVNTPQYHGHNRPRNAIRNCTFTFIFQCPMNWNDLDHTKQDRVRVCRVCKERVFLCRTASEALTHANIGHCVALPGQDGRGALFGLMVGMPVPLTDEQKALLKAEQADQANTKKIRAATKRHLRRV